MRWYVSPNGYFRGDVGGRFRYRHIVVWEQHFGPIPAGHQVRHRNGDKQDDRIENLQLVRRGSELRDGVRWKPCPSCGEPTAIDTEHWYVCTLDPDALCPS